MIAGFSHEVDENRALLSYYAAIGGNFLTDVSGQPVGLETSVRDCLYWLRNNPEERGSQPLGGGSLKTSVNL